MPVTRDRGDEPGPAEDDAGFGTVGDAPELGLADRTYLYIVQEGSSAVVPIPDQGDLLIGRLDTADVRLDDPSVSGRHAKLVAVESQVVLVHLGGDAPTFVNGEPITYERALVSGDVIGIGSATLVFHRDEQRPPRVLVDLEEVRGRLAAEAERSVRYGRLLAVVVVDLGVSDGERGKLAEAVGRELRVTDIAAWDGAAELLIVLPETAEAATTPVNRLLRALRVLSPIARAGLAVCPDDASDVNSLVNGARSAAASAGPGEVVRVADAVQTWNFADRSVTVADPIMKRLLALVQRLARSDLPVLITGESGVGKEIVASALHAWSQRKDKRFVSINCAAIPEALFESELFGHERGSFTGAHSAKAGLIEVADGGTLFLDEVGECPPGEQTKLLRVLETKRLMRIGAVADHPVDVRVVAATNRSLDADVAAGRFRRDLYFRLSAAAVIVPPLRDRTLDLPVLARAFLREACARIGRSAPPIAPATMYRLARYPWPGNLRELKNTMEYVAATADGPSVEPVHLPERVAGSAPSWMTAGGGPGEAFPANQPAAVPRSGRFRNIYEEIRELERTRMLEALHVSEGARRRAAELIGMPLRTFVTKLKEYDIDVPSRRADRPSSSRRGA